MSQKSGSVSGVRRALIWTVIVSFTIAAALGIIALLSGEWSTTVFQVLASTAAVGLMSLGLLCAFVALTTRANIVGWLAALTLIAATITAMGHIWLNEQTLDLWRFTSTLAVTAAGLSVASLLMPHIDSFSSKLRVVVYLTLAFIAATVIQYHVMIWSGYFDNWAIRLIGISAILATLGVITTLVMGALDRGTIHTVEPDISPELATRLTAAATKHGMTVEQFLGPVLAAAERAEPAAVRSAQDSDRPSRPAQPPQQR